MQILVQIFFFFKCPWTMSLGIFTWIKCSHYSFLLALPGISLLQRTGTLTYVPVSFSSAQLSADGVLQVRGVGRAHTGVPPRHTATESRLPVADPGLRVRLAGQQKNAEDTSHYNTVRTCRQASAQPWFLIGWEVYWMFRFKYFEAP